MGVYYSYIHACTIYIALYACIISADYFSLRKAALLLWKQQLGSRATYNKLISVFDHAGYKAYSENVRKFACASDSETDDSSGNEDSFPSPQPPTYPCLKPQDSPTPTELSLPEQSVPESYYILIHQAVLKSFPEGEKHNIYIQKERQTRSLYPLACNRV